MTGMIYGMTTFLGMGPALNYNPVNSFNYPGSMDFYPILSENISATNDILQSEAMYNRYEAGQIYDGAVSVAGDITFIPTPQLIGSILTRAIGSQNSHTLTNSVYIHSIFPAVTQQRPDDIIGGFALGPFVIEKYIQSNSFSQMFYNCQINTLKFDFAPGDFVKCTASILGTGMRLYPKSTPTYISEKEYTWDQTSISVAGAGQNYWENLSITINNNLAHVPTLSGSRESARIVRSGFRTLEISGTYVNVDYTVASDYHNTNEKGPLKVFIKGEAVSSGYTGDLTFDIPSYYYQEQSLNIEGADIIRNSFTGRATYNAGSGHMFKVTLVNTRASHA